jgi:hypothetical protein
MAAPWAALFVAGIWIFSLVRKLVDAGRKAAAADRQQKRNGTPQPRR